MQVPSVWPGVSLDLRLQLHQFWAGESGLSQLPGGPAFLGKFPVGWKHCPALVAEFSRWFPSMPGLWQ